MSELMVSAVTLLDEIVLILKIAVCVLCCLPDWMAASIARVNHHSSVVLIFGMDSQRQSEG